MSGTSARKTWRRQNSLSPQLNENCRECFGKLFEASSLKVSSRKCWIEARFVVRPSGCAILDSELNWSWRTWISFASSVLSSALIDIPERCTRKSNHKPEENRSPAHWSLRKLLHLYIHPLFEACLGTEL